MSVSFSSSSSFMPFLCLLKIKLPCPLVFPALPGVPQSPAVTSLQPLAAPPCVLIWPIVVNPEVSFLGQLHLIPPTPLPSLNNNWHSVLTQCQAFHRSWNSQKPGRGAEVPTVACAATCATPDNTGEEASQTHAALSQTHPATSEGLCPQFSPLDTLHLLRVPSRRSQLLLVSLCWASACAPSPLHPTTPHPTRTPRAIPRPKQHSRPCP